MRRLIDEYGLAILYAIVGAVCLGLFAMLFIGNDTEISKVVGNVVDNSTNQSIEVTYNINYDLQGGYFRVLKNQGDLGTLEVTAGAQEATSGGVTYYKISSFDQIRSKPSVDPDTGASFYWGFNNEKIWLTYTRNKSFSLPHAYDKDEDITYTNLMFDGWTGSGLNSKTRNAVIAKGSTGNRNYTANWTKGYYRIVYHNNIEFYKMLQRYDGPVLVEDYKAVTDSGYDITAWMSGSTKDILVEYGSYLRNDLTISENGYEFLGHEFISWNTKQDGSGTSYQAMTSATEDLIAYDPYADKDTQSVFNLYAQWKLVDYKIDYMTNDIQTAANDNPSTYRIIDKIELKTVTEDDYQTVTWYTVNPYLETSSTRTSYKFGTYEWAGKAYDDEGNLLYKFGLFNNTGVDLSIPERNLSATFKDQTISYGTFGDLKLHGYKTTGIDVFESHLTWKKETKPGVKEIDLLWLVEESEEQKMREIAGLEYFMTEQQVIDLLTLNDLTDELPVVKGYRYAGLESSSGALVFETRDGQIRASGDKQFWNAIEDEGGNITYYWIYTSNLDLYVRWTPLSYRILLHSNY